MDFIPKGEEIHTLKILKGIDFLSHVFPDEFYGFFHS